MSNHGSYHTHLWPGPSFLFQLQACEGFWLHLAPLWCYDKSFLQQTDRQKDRNRRGKVYRGTLVVVPATIGVSRTIHMDRWHNVGVPHPYFQPPCSGHTHLQTWPWFWSQLRRNNTKICPQTNRQTDRHINLWENTENQCDNVTVWLGLRKYHSLGEHRSSFRYKSFIIMVTIT